MMISADEFKNAMARLPTAVNVVTTNGASGAHGFTASAVCSVTDTPPTLLVCLNTSSRSHAHFLDNKVLCVNVLGAQHEPISNAFAAPLTQKERFARAAWHTLETGAPVLDDAQASFDCVIDEVKTVGSHSVLMCRVVAATHSELPQSDQGSLVYVNRAYHYVHQTADQGELA